jgi:hypothetical protein
MKNQNRKSNSTANCVEADEVSKDEGKASPIRLGVYGYCGVFVRVRAAVDGKHPVQGNRGATGRIWLEVDPKTGMILKIDGHVNDKEVANSIPTDKRNIKQDVDSILEAFAVR